MRVYAFVCRFTMMLLFFFFAELNTATRTFSCQTCENSHNKSTFFCYDLTRNAIFEIFNEQEKGRGRERVSE